MTEESKIESGKRFNKENSKKCNIERRKWMNREQLGQHIKQCFTCATYQTLVFNMACGDMQVQLHAFPIQAYLCQISLNLESILMK